MASVANGLKGSITYGGLDDSTQTVNFDLTATTAADAILDMNIIRLAYDAVVAGNYVGHSITMNYVEDAYVRPSATDAEGGEGAYLSVGIEDNPFKKASIYIPFPTAGIFQEAFGEGYNVINPVAASVLDVVALYLAGGESYISDGESADRLISGRRK